MRSAYTFHFVFNAFHFFFFNLLCSLLSVAARWEYFIGRQKRPFENETINYLIRFTFVYEKWLNFRRYNNNSNNDNENNRNKIIKRFFNVPMKFMIARINSSLYWATRHAPKHMRCCVAVRFGVHSALFSAYKYVAIEIWLNVRIVLDVALWHRGSARFKWTPQMMRMRKRAREFSFFLFMKKNEFRLFEASFTSKCSSLASDE